MKGETKIMNYENKQLLDEVIQDRLVKAQGADADAAKVAFGQAMEAIDRQIELSKVEASHDEQLEKQELAKKEARNTWIIRGVEIGATCLAVPVIQYCCNKGFAKLMCNFEKDYTFTTSAGRSLSRLFNFKK